MLKYYSLKLKENTPKTTSTELNADDLQFSFLYFVEMFF